MISLNDDDRSFYHFKGVGMEKSNGIHDDHPGDSPERNPFRVRAPNMGRPGEL